MNASALHCPIVDTDDTYVPDREATVIVPSEAPTDLVELAWSSDIDALGELPTERYTWRATWLRVSVFIVSAGVLAGALGFGAWGWVQRHDSRPPAPQPTSAAVRPPGAQAPAAAQPPIAAPAPTVVIPPSPAAEPAPTLDDRFLAELDQAGIGYTNRAGQIGQGRQICAALDDGETTRQLLQEMNGTEWSKGIIRAAISVYCPQYR